jgi:hypothetical protein
VRKRIGLWQEVWFKFNHLFGDSNSEESYLCVLISPLLKSKANRNQIMVGYAHAFTTCQYSFRRVECGRCTFLHKLAYNDIFELDAQIGDLGFISG